MGGALVSAQRQEDFGLLTIADATSNCSASLLRNGWAITAAHCVDAKDARGNTMPDPKRPGQNILRPINGFRLTANWKQTQTKQAVQVETFWPYDVALIRVDTPFKVYGDTKYYSRLIFQDGQFPYWGEPVGASLISFGRGIHTFAKGAGSTATPAQRDGKYRVGYLRPTRNGGTLYWYPSSNGAMIAGGDSGGPSFAWTLGGYALVGVHALCEMKYVPGKPTTGWDWATLTPNSADALIAPLWNRIHAIMGPKPSSEPEFSAPIPPTGPVGVFPPTPILDLMWVYGIRPNGDLIWYRHTGFNGGTNSWANFREVGDGWLIFKDVFCTGQGSIYAVTNEGTMYLYKHTGYPSGNPTWEPRRLVHSGWKYKQSIPSDEGTILALGDDGKLTWHRHLGLRKPKPGGIAFRQNLVETWEGPVSLGKGWLEYGKILSVISSPPVPGGGLK